MKVRIAKILTTVNLVWSLLIPILWFLIEGQISGIGFIIYSTIFRIFVLTCFVFSAIVPLTAIIALVLSRKNHSRFRWTVNLVAPALALWVLVRVYLGLAAGMGV